MSNSNILPSLHQLTTKPRKQTVILGFVMFVTFILCMSKNKMHYHHKDQQRQYYRSKSKINSRNRENQLDYSRIPTEKEHISQVLEPMTQNPEPRWMTYLKGQQFVKKRLKAKLNATKVWKNNRPSADCNVIGFLNGSAVNPNSIYNRRVALGSFPGSGNTWLRHLFHVTAGVWTGSLYFDKKLYKGGFLGEVSDCFDPSVFGIKVHDKLHADVMKCHFDVIVLVLRNPYHSILSEFNRRQGLSHVALASEEAFHGPDWERYASMKTKSFQEVLSRWLEICDRKNPNHRPCHVISYQQLVSNTRQEIGKLLQFLNIPRTRLRCLDKVGLKDGPFHRKKQKEAQKVDKSQPMCLLTSKTSELLHHVIEEGKSKLLNLSSNGANYAEELSYQLPVC